MPDKTDTIKSKIIDELEKCSDSQFEEFMSTFTMGISEGVETEFTGLLYQIMISEDW